VCRIDVVIILLLSLGSVFASLNEVKIWIMESRLPSSKNKIVLWQGSMWETQDRHGLYLRRNSINKTHGAQNSSF